MEGTEEVQEGLLGSAGSGSWTFRTFMMEGTGRTWNQVRGSLVQVIIFEYTSIYDVRTDVDKFEMSTHVGGRIIT